MSRDFAEIWQAADKVVYSTTLVEATSARTRIERAFDPDAVRQLKAQAAHDLSVGGPDLAAQAIRAGLVDELQLFLTPIVVGGGTQALPDKARVPLELLDEHRFRRRHGLPALPHDRLTRRSRGAGEPPGTTGTLFRAPFVRVSDTGHVPRENPQAAPSPSPRPRARRACFSTIPLHFHARV